MKLRNLKLTLSNVTHKSAKTVPVNAVGEIHATGTNGEQLEEVVGFTVTVAVYRDELKVKLPVNENIKQKIEQLRANLENEFTTEISFTNLKLTPYVLKSESGNILSGISAKCDDITIESTSAEEIEIDL